MTNLTGIAVPELQFTLLYAGNAYILANAPKGWEGTLVTQDRDTTYYAVKREYTVPMDFVLDGAYLLRLAFYNYGVQANMQLLIGQSVAGSDVYNTISTSDIDFSQFLDGEDVVTVNCMDAGIESKVKAYGDVTYEIDLADGFDIELTPLLLEEQAQFLIVTNGQGNVKTATTANFSPEIRIVTNQQNSVNSVIQAPQYDETQHPDYNVYDRWFLNPTIATNVNLKGSISGVVEGQGAFNFFIVNRAGVNVHTLYHYDQAGIGDTHSFGVDFDFDVAAVANDVFYVRFEFVGSGTFNPIIAGFSGDMLATYKVISPASNCRAMRAVDVFAKLLQKMNGGFAYPYRSYLLGTEWYQLVITSGEAIRQLDSPVISLSWNDFWQSINSVCNAEVGDERGTYVLERKNNAFKRTLPIINVGEAAKGWTLAPYVEYLFSSITVGYDDINLDRTGGRKIVNSIQKYTTPITRVQKDLNLVSKIGAEILEIESLRVNFAGLDSTDKSADNKAFFVYLKANLQEGKWRPEGVEAFSSVTNVDTGAYNLKITPKQNLYRHSDYIAGAMDKLSGAVIQFASAEKDVSIITVSLSSVRIAEGENVMISNLGLQLFLPYAVTFKCKFPNNAVGNVTNLPNGYVSFTIDGVAYRGFILTASIDPARNSSQQLKVLLTVDNDLTNLIR